MTPIYTHIGSDFAAVVGDGVWTEYDGTNSSGIDTIFDSGDFVLSNLARRYNNLIYGIARPNASVEPFCIIAFRSHYIAVGTNLGDPQQLDVERIVTNQEILGSALDPDVDAVIFVEATNGDINSYVMYHQSDANETNRRQRMWFDCMKVDLAGASILQSDQDSLGRIQRPGGGLAGFETTVQHVDHCLLGNGDLIIMNRDDQEGAFGVQQRIFYIIPGANGVNLPTASDINHEAGGSAQTSGGANTFQTYQDISPLDGNFVNYQDGITPVPTVSQQDALHCKATAAPGTNQGAILQVGAVLPVASDVMAVALNIFETQNNGGGGTWKTATGYPPIELSSFFPNINNSHYGAKPTMVYLPNIEKFIVMGRGGPSGSSDLSHVVILLEADAITREFTILDSFEMWGGGPTQPGNLNRAVDQTTMRSMTFQQSEPLITRTFPTNQNENRLIENDVSRDAFVVVDDALNDVGEAVFVGVTIAAESTTSSSRNFTDADNFANNFGTGLFAIRVEGDQLVRTSTSIRPCDPSNAALDPALRMDHAVYINDIDDSFFIFERVGGVFADQIDSVKVNL